MLIQIALSNNKPTLNSSGKPIHSTAQGIENFWKWFGKSICVNAKGQPIVTYHGTAENINEHTSFVNWFSYEHKGAVAYAELRDYRKGSGGNVMPCYIRAELPFDGDRLTRGDNTVASFVMEMAQQARDNKVNFSIDRAKYLLDVLKSCACVEGSGPHYSPQDFWFNTSSFFGSEGQETLRKLYALFKFDSILFTEDGETTVGVFFAKNVKSAIGNSGKFGQGTSIIACGDL
jgi:ADP-Ribosyltransferase in polyvalent proteins